MKKKIQIMATVTFLGLNLFSAHATEPQPDAPFEMAAKTFFENNCTSCHGERRQKANVTLHDLPMDFNSPEMSLRWMKVLSQLENGEMPPEERRQPSHAERMRMINGIRHQFRAAGNPIERLRADPKYGNYVNHRDLFSGDYKGPAYSRPRIWRISPHIDGKSSPFSLSQDEGFKDYAHMWSMDKPTIELLLVKAQGVVEQQIGPSEADLTMQDEVWKKQILTKRRSLRHDVEKPKEQRTKDPENEGLKKKLENLTK
ncbi:MAG: c-type cytochrome domain-containing protein, partial [Verrucomicrobiota bacterium]